MHNLVCTYIYSSPWCWIHHRFEPKYIISTLYPNSPCVSCLLRFVFLKPNPIISTVTTLDLTTSLDCSCFGAIQLVVSVSGAESLGIHVKTWALPPGIFIDSCDCPGRFHGFNFSNISFLPSCCRLHLLKLEVRTLLALPSLTENRLLKTLLKSSTTAYPFPSKFFFMALPPAPFFFLYLYFLLSFALSFCTCSVSAVFYYYCTCRLSHRPLFVRCFFPKIKRGRLVLGHSFRSLIQSLILTSVLSLILSSKQ